MLPVEHFTPITKDTGSNEKSLDSNRFPAPPCPICGEKTKLTWKIEHCSILGRVYKFEATCHGYYMYRLNADEVESITEIYSARIPGY